LIFFNLLLYIIYINIITFILNLNLISEITPEYRIEFDKKVKRFRNRNSMVINKTKLDIFINRENLFYDAYNQIMSKSPLELRNKLCITYLGERGIDLGGLLR